MAAQMAWSGLHLVADLTLDAATDLQELAADLAASLPQVVVLFQTPTTATASFVELYYDSYGAITPEFGALHFIFSSDFLETDLSTLLTAAYSPYEVPFSAYVVVPTPPVSDVSVAAQFTQALRNFGLSTYLLNAAALEGFMTGLLFVEVASSMSSATYGDAAAFAAAFHQKLYSGTTVGGVTFSLPSNDSSCHQASQSAWVAAWGLSSDLLAAVDFTFSVPNCGMAGSAPAKSPLMISVLNSVFNSPVGLAARSITDGVLSALVAVNAAGGVNGRQVRAVYLGDSYTASLAVRNAKLITKEYPEIVALVGAGGTTSATAILNYLNNFTSPPFIVVSPSSGSITFFTQPLVRNSRMIRTCYQKEAALWASHFHSHFALDARMVVVYWDNDFGHQLRDFLRGLMAEYGRSVYREVALPTVVSNFYPYLAEVLRCDPQGIAIIALAQTSFTTTLVSVAGVGTQLYLLSVSYAYVPTNYTSQEDNTVLLTQVVPPPFLATPAARHFLADMAQFDPSTSYVNDFLAFESYLAARLTVSALADKSVADAPSFLRTLDALVFKFEDLSLGPFNDTHPNGLDEVWLTKVHVKNGTVEAVETEVALPCTCEQQLPDMSSDGKDKNLGAVVGVPVGGVFLFVMAVGLLTGALVALFVFRKRRSSKVLPFDSTPRTKRTFCLFKRKVKLILARVGLILVSILMLCLLVFCMYVTSRQQSIKATRDTLHLLMKEASVTVATFNNEIMLVPIIQTVQAALYAKNFKPSTSFSSWSYWGTTFYQQMQITTALEVNNMYMGTDSGEFCGVKASENTAFLYGSCPEGTCSWQIDSSGSIVGFPHTYTVVGDSLDARSAPWYLFPSLSKHSTWSGFVRGSNATSYMSFSTPVVDSSGTVTAVFGIDFSLEKLQNLLENLELTDNSAVATVELDGSVIASSLSSLQPFINSTSSLRQNVLTCTEKKMRCGAKWFAEKLASGDVSKALRINETTASDTLIARIQCSGETVYALLTNYIDAINHTTAIIMVTPEKDLTEPITKGNRTVLFIFLGVVAAMVVLVSVGLFLFTRSYEKIAAQSRDGVVEDDKLDTGQEKVLKILKRIIETTSDKKTTTALQTVISILTESAGLFQPDLDKVEDKDVHTWIQQAFASAEQTRGLAVHRKNSVSSTDSAANSDISIVSDSFLVQSITSWDFDVFTVHDKLKEMMPPEAPSRVLRFCVLEVFKARDLLDYLPSLEKFITFLDKLEAQYSLYNPYHTALHAADVTLCVNYMLQPSVVAKLNLTPFEIITVLIAAAGHDVGHDGRNNIFHNAVDSERALMFNNKSVQENFHVKLLQQLLRDFKIFSHLSTTEAKYARNLTTDLILATDMALHFEYSGKMSSRLENPQFRPSEGQDKLLMLQMILKMADISNPTKPVPLMRQWSGRVLSEFFQQGDEEAKLGLPISPFMDRGSSDVIKSQLGFVRFIVGPMLELVEKIVGPEVVREPSACLRRTLAYWESPEASMPELL
eukprot:TRINITY_DN1282_c1_g2_i1.p1 TRINITY_DN1282_c1_g2~~TRINITY_DN1282_c1_g2_i1.p1  ORF type:complete len:1656 (+),score=396.18 TRINITY_DN1282_c1_g2_i1:495-4970(+)